MLRRQPQGISNTSSVVTCWYILAIFVSSLSLLSFVVYLAVQVNQPPPLAPTPLNNMVTTIATTIQTPPQSDENEEPLVPPPTEGIDTATTVGSAPRVPLTKPCTVRYVGIRYVFHTH
eukprot:PhF_6_TR41028/c0_g1_i3/m.62147